MIKDARLRLAVSVRPAKSSGMRQLQSNKQSFIGSGCLPMLFDQHFPQLRKSLSRMLYRDELIRIRSPFVRNGNRFPAPD